MAEQPNKPPKKPPPKPPKSTASEGIVPGELDTGTTPPKELTEKEKKALKKLKQQAQQIAGNYKFNNRGGAPADPAFVLAALQQGLSPNDIRVILNSQALGGPITGPAYSSTELLDFFTENPEKIAGLLDAAKTAADAPENYAEYLAGGGKPGGYQSQNQLIQQAVFGIEGAKEAYIAGTTKAKWIAEGNDPAQWYNYSYNLRNKAKPAGGPSFIGGFDVDQFNAMQTRDLGDLATATEQMFQAKQQKEYAQTFEEDYFSPDQVESDV